MKSILWFIVGCTIFSTAAFAQIDFKHEKVIDHGKISQGDVISGQIEFVNNTGKMVELVDVRTSCGCTAVKPEKKIFEPGETAHIPYTIETERFSGVIRKSIRLVFKDEDPKSEVLFVEANVTTDVSINPRFINFQKVTLNPDTVYTEFFEIENSSQTELNVTKIAADIDIVKITPSNVVIPAGKSHLVRVDLVPSKTGRMNSNISIETNNKKFQSKSLPVFINILEHDASHSE